MLKRGSGLGYASREHVRSTESGQTTSTTYGSLFHAKQHGFYRRARQSSVERGQPITFGLNQVIPGWTEGLQLMKKGEKFRLFIPPELGYGNRSAGSIPPGSVLVFDVELLDFF